MYRIGLLAPFRELPGEFADVIAEAPEPAAHWQVITAAEDSHRLAALQAAGDLGTLEAGARRMRRWEPDVVSWACTSGSFVGGRKWAQRQLRAITAASGAPASSTSVAFVEALGALAIDEVAVIAPYPQSAAAAFAAFLAEWGIAVRASVELDAAGPTVSERLDARDLAPALERVGKELPILLPDTALWGFGLHRELAPRLAVPLLVANQVTLWHAFEIAGVSTDSERFGALRLRAAPGITGDGAY
ncbi:MAG TPA: hypothetical protein VHF88_05225 [Thermoleophilaceae bacterium]|nr:hypothetical protein [Thermoleophilaceae bacterium]